MKKSNKKTRESAKNEQVYKICQKCFDENDVDSKVCQKCGGSKFAPEYIKKLEKVSGNTFAQVTVSSVDKNERITLYKWWPGGRSSFNINTPEQWEKIAEIIQTRLIPYLGWRSKESLVQEIITSDKDTEKQIKNLTKSYPELIRNFLQEFDITQYEEKDHTDIAEILREISGLLAKTDVGFREAFMRVVQNLPKENKRAVEDLADLLKTWSLKQITSISTQVIDRIQTLELFKNRILDDKTYEIRGEDSIHRILERAMWIIDERYWLLHSNETLRTIVGNEIVKKNKGNEKKRPDFVCGSVGDKLIIVELKRPSHPLTVDDLNQLEMYLSIIEQHHSGKTFECYLIGKSVSVELERIKKHRASHFKVRTFADLIDDTEKRYTEYIKDLNQSKKDKKI